MQTGRGVLSIPHFYGYRKGSNVFCIQSSAGPIYTTLGGQKGRRPPICLHGTRKGPYIYPRTLAIQLL